MRIKYIDSAKGLAMLLIVWGHTVTFYEPIAEWALGFKITLFYVVTGYLLGSRSYEDGTVKKTPIKKLAASMGVPYVFYSLLSFLVAVAVFAVEKHSADFLAEKLLRFFTLGGISTLWFLPSIFIGRIVFEQLYTKKQSVAIRLLRPGVTLLFTVAAAMNLNKLQLEPEISLNYVAYLLVLVIFKGIIAFWFIAAGYEIYKLKEKFKPGKAVSLTVAVAAVALSVVLSQLNKGTDFNNGSLGMRPVLFFVTGIFASWGIIELLSLIYTKISCRFLEFIGENSLFIMSTHLPLYIVPLIFSLVCAVIRSVGTGYDYIRAVLTFVLVLMIEWLLITAKKRLTSRVKNERIGKLLRYI